MGSSPQMLTEALAERTREGELYTRLPDGWVCCFACGHRCKIPPGKQGVCRVRFNRDGRLRVPFGYVGALQLDPVEKKPFFHAYPGVLALSFGMLGCDLHCGFCFPPGTLIATSQGPRPIEELFDSGEPNREEESASVAIMPGASVFSHTGRSKDVLGVFRHRYSGRLCRIRAKFLPPLECTPDHEVLVLRSPRRGRPLPRPTFAPAASLGYGDYLAVPKRFEFSRPVALDALDLLRPRVRPYRVGRKISRETLVEILARTERGEVSREIGVAVGKTPSHIRHLRSKVRRGEWRLDRLGVRTGGLKVEGDRIRFSNEHRPGIPHRVPLDENLAALLGYYCAEGSVVRDRSLVQAAEVNFAFGLSEGGKVMVVRSLVERCFGVDARTVRRETTLTVTVSKASLAAFVTALCGKGARSKRVPAPLFDAPRPVVEAFLEAYVDGDGYRSPNGSVTVSTVSPELARGVAWLALKLGHLPALYAYAQPTRREIQGRPIRQASRVYMVRWYPKGRRKRQYREDDEYYYVPVQDVVLYDYEGPVYNLEVAEDHTYLANFVAVHNCQNWLTSQALRDPMAGAPPQDITPEGLVDLAEEYGAQILASTYNEPLITSEWAVAVFREARARGMTTAYISNGNGTEEVLDYLRPWVDLYKIDLKSFNDKTYRKLGGVLERVLETIILVYEKGFWLEVVTLIVPGFNDSPEELREIAEFLVSVSPQIPWHVTAFHKDYKMIDPDNTPARTLIRAAEIGQEAGLQFVYAGNLPGQVGPYEDTICPGCGELLIERYGFTVRRCRLQDGACPTCGKAIPGRWPGQEEA